MSKLPCIIVVVFSIYVTPAYASKVCYNRDHAAAYFKEKHDMELHSWGLDDDGNMMELFLSESGHWAVITTQPNKCSSLISPQKLWGRLWQPPRTNKAVPPRPLNDGDPT